MNFFIIITIKERHDLLYSLRNNITNNKLKKGE